MSNVQTQFAQTATPAFDFSATPILDFFCPELKDNALSFASPLAYRTQLLCHAASIRTVKDLVAQTEQGLRLKSFCKEAIGFINEKLDEAGLKLSPDHYPSAVPAQLHYLNQLQAK